MVARVTWNKHLKWHMFKHFVNFKFCPIWGPVVYFDQLSGAARTQKLIETLFSAVFNLKILKKDKYQRTGIEKREGTNEHIGETGDIYRQSPVKSPDIITTYTTTAREPSIYVFIYLFIYLARIKRTYIVRCCERKMKDQCKCEWI